MSDNVRRLILSHEDEIRRQAGLAGVSADVFGADVLAGRAERIASLKAGQQEGKPSFRMGAHIDARGRIVVSDDPTELHLTTPDAEQQQEINERVARTLRPTRDIRSIKNARELHEAADNAEKGIPPVGSLAWSKIDNAEKMGDFDMAARIRESVKAFAPMIRDAANAKELADKVENASHVADVTTQERARQKRERKAARRRKESDNGSDNG